MLALSVIFPIFIGEPSRAVFDRFESLGDSPLSRILIQDLCW